MHKTRIINQSYKATCSNGCFSLIPIISLLSMQCRDRKILHIFLWRLLLRLNNLKCCLRTKHLIEHWLPQILMGTLCTYKEENESHKWSFISIYYWQPILHFIVCLKGCTSFHPQLGTSLQYEI